MINYEIIEYLLAGEPAFGIIRHNLDGSATAISQDEANPEYRQYLDYVAWVESGNSPEEFWSQSV